MPHIKILIVFTAGFGYIKNRVSTNIPVMKTHILLLAFILTGTACTAQKDLARKNVYSFALGNELYQITSINTKSGEGVNYLTQINELGETVLKARDLNQDGFIDNVLKGTLSLIEVNEIYTAGINFARADGNYEERVSLRTYEFITDNTRYTIKTYIIGPENATNLFIIYNHLINEESILSDTNADGTLDSVENGALTLEEANILYKQVLEEGMKSRRIVKIKNTFLVQEDPLSQTASLYKE